MVPKAGVEPARCCQRQILSLLRLPIPPLRHGLYYNIPATDLSMSAQIGFELADELHIRLEPRDAVEISASEPAPR